MGTTPSRPSHRRASPGGSPGNGLQLLSLKSTGPGQPLPPPQALLAIKLRKYPHLFRSPPPPLSSQNYFRGWGRILISLCLSTALKTVGHALPSAPSSERSSCFFSYFPRTFSLSFACSLQPLITDMPLKSFHFSIFIFPWNISSLCVDTRIISVGDSQLSGSNQNLSSTADPQPTPLRCPLSEPQTPNSGRAPLAPMGSSCPAP